jgi:hypothetical protein
MSQELQDALDLLAEAREFLDLCRKDPKSVETGAMRDALKWVEEEVDNVLKAYRAEAS